MKTPWYIERQDSHDYIERPSLREKEGKGRGGGGGAEEGEGEGQMNRQRGEGRGKRREWKGEREGGRAGAHQASWGRWRRKGGGGEGHTERIK